MTVRKNNEHKAVAYAARSLCEGSIYAGHGNSEVYQNVHYIAEDLINHKLLPKGCYLGRMGFAGIKSLTRAAIAVDADWLHRVQDSLIIYALTKGYDPDELLRVLNYCSINAASNGHIDFQSITCLKGFRVLRALPVSVRSGVLQGRYKTVRLFSAV